MSSPVRFLSPRSREYLAVIMLSGESVKTLHKLAKMANLSKSHWKWNKRKLVKELSKKWWLQDAAIKANKSMPMTTYRPDYRISIPVNQVSSYVRQWKLQGGHPSKYRRTKLKHQR
jgi:hypothetical protein